MITVPTPYAVKKNLRARNGAAKLPTAAVAWNDGVVTRTHNRFIWIGSILVMGSESLIVI